MADSKSVYTTTGAGISNRWLVGLWIAVMSNRSIARVDHDHPLLHDVPTLHVFWQLLVIRRSHRNCTSRFLRDFVILCITMTKDAMLEIAQVIEHTHESIESGYLWNANVFHRSTGVGRGIVNDHCGEQVVVLTGNLQIGGADQWWIHINHVAISSDIKHIWLIERSG